MTRYKEFHLSIPDTPGTLANITEVLGQAGVNIEGIFEYSIDGDGYVCLLTNNPDSTESTFKSSGVTYSTNDIVVTNLENKPGALGQITRAFANADININGCYLTFGGHQVFSTTNSQQAESIAKQMGVLWE